ncbi:FMN-binding protein [Feifania hominis]|uniref:FMN-binding protein n=1 Tax=Feifania hominis TaxID=2763660 RepID=A0A926DC04_9FIRM|nr:FMN-binding protein [Feifania hominis]MBC8535087.1 FMN-binding protein [Feifania hominis]
MKKKKNIHAILAPVLFLVVAAIFVLSIYFSGAWPGRGDNGSSGGYTPGTYTVETEGMHAMTLEVTFSEDRITDIRFAHQEETEGVADEALAEVPKRILEAQAYEVDGVSGATYTSDGIKNGVKLAMELARGGSGSAVDPGVDNNPGTDVDDGPVSDATDLRTGIGVVSSLSSSKAPADGKDGTAQTDATIAAVTVDRDGRIVACTIDAIQAKIGFDASGAITTGADAQFQTKQELGRNYGMYKASSIGKEWSEQADAFAQYAVGKTVAELKGLAVNEAGAPTDTDLNSSVTLSVGGFLEAIEKAVANASGSSAQGSDTLRLAVITSASSSTSATADKEGTAQSDSTIAAVTLDRDGKITSCVIDALQAKVKIDATGAIKTDLAEPVKTKNELGQNYGMHKASSIGKEWNEQAAAFSQYVVGKTASEVAGIAVDEQGKAADTDLVSSVTVAVSPFVQIVEKAAK